MKKVKLLISLVVLVYNLDETTQKLENHGRITQAFLNNNRRNFLKKAGLGIGGLALGSLLDPFNFGKEVDPFSSLNNNGLNLPHFAPKAKELFICFKVEVLHSLIYLIISQS